MNPNNIMKQVRQMQSKMMQVQEKLASETVEAQVGGGMVSATFTGQGDIVSIKIDPEVINPDDKEMLEDLIVSAVNEGLKKSRDLMTERMGGITGALGGALGSMGMGF
ncbi:MAG: YbaB/EbfC family nucleoid-associated protein [Synergistaceae bacterium]|nr:YbaB/EbfC family nucleoid-associated protein [Synergistaceae bacterium]